MSFSFATLTEEELTVVNAFDIYGELLMPEWAFSEIYSSSQTRKILESLEKKKVIVKAKPYRLTKLGRLLKKQLGKKVIGSP